MRQRESMASHTSLAAEGKWQDKCSGGFVIIGRAGGPDNEPTEKVAGTEEQISLPQRERAQFASWALLNFSPFLCFKRGRSSRGW